MIRQQRPIRNAEVGGLKPFAYKLVRQVNEELEEKVLSQSQDLSAENIMKKNSTAWTKPRHICI